MRIKEFILVIAMIIAVRSLAACGPVSGNGLKITGSPAEMDGVTVTLDTATAERMTKPDRYEYSFSGTITNNSDVGVMKVIYTFSLRDKDGEEFRSFGSVYDGGKRALAPNESVPFSLEGVKWGSQSVPASVEIGVSSVSTEEELPPAIIPEAGDPLYLALGDEKLENILEEPPVELQFHIDQGGYGRTATFTEGPELDKAVELLCRITIVGEADEWVTDNYNWIRLTWEDGSSYFISLNMRNLELSIHNVPHTYWLEDLDAFWNYASKYLTED